MAYGYPEYVPAQLPRRGWNRHDLHQVRTWLRLTGLRDRHAATTRSNNDRVDLEVCAT
jgi:hypothetical protein